MRYELTGKINNISKDYFSKRVHITLAIDDSQSVRHCYDELHEAEKLSIVIDKYKEKRSSEANRYFWKLCGELAKKLSDEGVKHTNEEIYRNTIKESGLWADDEVLPDKVEWRKKAWSQIGLGWFAERVDFTPDGEREIIRFYYGSSQYNSKQMWRIIQNIKQACEEQGIPTKTPNEIADMLSLLERANEKHNSK